MATSGEALFGINVIDTDAPSHLNHSSKSVLESGGNEKRIDEQAVVARRGNFTPIVMSVDGFLQRETEQRD